VPIAQFDDYFRYETVITKFLGVSKPVVYSEIVEKAVFEDSSL
jgi:hypothetical protein